MVSATPDDEDANETPLIDGLNDTPFPPLQWRPSPKSYKEQKLEEERERARLVKEHEKRYLENSKSSGKYATDDDFLMREFNESSVESPDEEEEEIVRPVNVFKEDLESYKEVPKYPVPSVSELDDQDRLTAYEILNQPRAKVKWSKKVMKGFNDFGDVLEMVMAQKGIKRAANATKRIAKAESMNVKMTRYTCEQVQQRVAEGVEDLFGLQRLVPHSLNKSDEDATDSRRKKKLLTRFQEQMCDFDYPNRPYARERAEGYAEYQKKIAEYEQLEKDIKKYEARKKVLLEEIAAQRAQEAKRVYEERSDNESSQCAEEPPVTKTKNLEGEPIEAARQSSSCPGVDQRDNRQKIEMELEEKRKSEALKKRREATLAREKEREDAAKKAAEEMKKKKEAELEEQNRLKEERRRQEEEDRKLEELRAAALKDLIEKQRRQQEAEKALDAEIREQAVKKREAEELERLQSAIEGLRRNVDEQQQPVITLSPDGSSDGGLTEVSGPTVSPINLQDSWNFLKIKNLESWKAQQAEKFRAHFNLPEFSTFELEKDELKGECLENGAVVIPHENNARTTVFQLHGPPMKEKTPVLPPPAPVTPTIERANEEATELVVAKVREMVTPLRATPVLIDLYKEETDYQQTSLTHLKPRYLYPFRPSDGLYWPVFFACEAHGDNEVSCFDHVEALAVCNTFSGKYASYHLLTTPLSEDVSPEKKFDEAYADSDGDFATYSKKPGRFSNRFGFKAHRSKCQGTLEEQRQRARDRMRMQYNQESERDQRFETARCEYNEGTRDESNYNDSVKIHLRHLVEDARLDTYSTKEEILGHPGTRRSPLEVWWHTHGYYIWPCIRAESFAKFMQHACSEYEKMCPRPCMENLAEFEEWCFAPMLASLYYQITHDTFQVFPKEKAKFLEERRRKYNALLMKETRFSLKEVKDVCRLDECDKEQWTFLHDQLVTHFKQLPSVSTMMYDQSCDLLDCVHQSVEAVMKGVKKDSSNQWGQAA